MSKKGLYEQRAWHALGRQSVLSLVDSSADGLDQLEAQDRLELVGRNELPDRKHRAAIIRFFAQFRNVLIYVLLASAAITLLLSHFLDTAVILAVVLVNAAIGFVQEGKAERAIEAIRRMLVPHAVVARGGVDQKVDAAQLVPGDVIALTAGDRVPADTRILTASGLQVQEAILTGESVPVEKGTRAVEEITSIGDRTSMAFCGTLVTHGAGRGIVVATGVRTEAGKISGMLAEVTTVVTPLVKQMNDFGRWLTVLILLIAGSLLTFGYFVKHQAFDEIFMAVVGLSVAAIPEGLPAVFTITLAVGVRAMARRDAIVRRLPAIETLGSVSVICTDKTGTLTLNEMTVTSIITTDRAFSVEGTGYEPKGQIFTDESEVPTARDQSILNEIALVGSLCNNACLRESDGTWTIEGDPMEAALLTLSTKVGLDISATKQMWQRSDTIPFDAQRRFMGAVHQDADGRKFVTAKGAPENLIEMCRCQRSGPGQEEPIDVDYWNAKVDSAAQRGQRVLAIASSDSPPNKASLSETIDNSLTLIGLVCLIDPPRPEAAVAVAECQDAGILVKMITGDHKGTAKSIARQIGIRDFDDVLTGAEIDMLGDTQLAIAASKAGVFARTSPEHKLRLVKALQSLDMTVAMTGDGINDAPALKRANVGIAMGKGGTEAAKEAAAIVLADDNFASIVAAVREGRTVYNNFRKVVSWTLPTSSGEALTVVIALLVGTTLPVTPVQILWVNLVTVATLGLALAFEPTEPDTMHMPPRKRNEPLLSTSLAWHILFVSILFLASVFGVFSYAISQDYTLSLARTMSVNTLVVLEIFHLFFVRNMFVTSVTWQELRGTPVIWVTVAIVVFAQVSITYFEPLQYVLETQSIPLVDGLLILGVGVATYLILETETRLRLSLAPCHKWLSSRERTRSNRS